MAADLIYKIGVQVASTLSQGSCTVGLMINTETISGHVNSMLVVTLCKCSERYFFAFSIHDFSFNKLKFDVVKLCS